MKARYTYFLLILTVTFWGSGYAVSKLAIHFVPPSTSIFMRFLIISLFMIVYLVLHFSALKPFTRKQHIKSIAMGVFLAFYNWFFLIGLDFSNVVIDSIMIESAFTPVFTILLAAYIFKDRMQKRRQSGLLIALIGTFIFFFPLLQLEKFDSIRMQGYLILLVSVACFGAYTLIGQSIFQERPPSIVTAYAMLVSTVILFLFHYPS